MIALSVALTYTAISIRRYARVCATDELKAENRAPIELEDDLDEELGGEVVKTRGRAQARWTEASLNAGQSHCGRGAGRAW